MPFFERLTGTVMGLRSSYSGPVLQKSLLLNGPLYVKLQIILLYSQENERRAARECLGSHFDKATTMLAWLVHFYRTQLA
jgi:hypothetical protein